MGWARRVWDGMWRNLVARYKLSHPRQLGYSQRDIERLGFDPCLVYSPSRPCPQPGGSSFDRRLSFEEGDFFLPGSVYPDIGVVVFLVVF